MTKNPAPYVTREPWLGFTPRERLRISPLRLCPSTKCRRAKACVDAHDDLYCQRTHQGVPQPHKAQPARSARGFTSTELAVIREKNDERLAEVAAMKRLMVAKWKAGAFDALYGKFRQHGVWKHPPQRQYTEE
jgi:hypothetical protein